VAISTTLGVVRRFLESLEVAERLHLDRATPAAILRVRQSAAVSRTSHRKRQGFEPKSPRTTSFAGFVKQVNAAAMSEAQKSLFAVLFPRFFDPIPKLTKERREGLERSIEGFDRLQISDPIAVRRYGGRDLPRNRYYSVAQDESGNDRGTLGNEIRAYRDPVRTGMVEVLDFSIGEINLVPDPADLQRVLRFSREPFIGALIHQPQRVLELLKQTDYERIELGEKGWAALVKFPFRVQPVSFDNVVDLRRQDTRDWFAQQFSHPDEDIVWPETFSGPMADPPKTIQSVSRRVEERSPIPQTFEQMLPTMMNPVRGGGDFEWGGTTLMAIAAWMRNRTVEAFIYPSARNDVHVVEENGEVTSFAGWCLLDLTFGTDEERNLYTIFDSSPWSWTALPHGARLIRPGAGDAMKGFAIDGLVQTSAEEYKEEIKSLEQVEIELGPYGGRLTQLEAFWIGVATLEWLIQLLVEHRRKEKPEKLMETSRPLMRLLCGLLLRNDLEMFVHQFLDVYASLFESGDIQEAGIHTVQVIERLQRFGQIPLAMAQIIASIVDLQLSIMVLTRFAPDEPVEGPLSAEGLRSLELPESLASKADEYLAMIAKPASRAGECLQAAVDLRAQLLRHYEA
jgi:hypothetical protein